jgi:CRP/FNR family cyclic AMP-dependent transcriptional regulator
MPRILINDEAAGSRSRGSRCSAGRDRAAFQFTASVDEFSLVEPTDVHDSWPLANHRYPRPTDPLSVIKKHGLDTTTYRTGEPIFSQGDEGDYVFYIEKGAVQLAVLSGSGREAIVAILQEHSFFGEGALLTRPIRLASAMAFTDCTLRRIGSVEMLKALHTDAEFAELFTDHLLKRNSRIEADVADHLLNSSEKRLARVLLLLANCDQNGAPQPVCIKMSHEILAEMVGTTRSRVSFFMNRFRSLGLIEYQAGQITVHKSLRNILQE